jgi:putative iron-dependent peroxidase
MLGASTSRPPSGGIDMRLPQFGIFAQGTVAHEFIEFDVRAGVDQADAGRAITQLEQPAVAAGGVNLVLAFSADLWRRMAPDETPAGLGPFRELIGLDGRGAPATQHDAFVWISGSSSDVVFEQSRAAMKAVADVAVVATEQACFVHRDSRDLLGFIDGTKNPPSLEAPLAALVPPGEPGAGGSHVLVMRWVHDLDRFELLPVAEQERVFGRRRIDSVELSDEDKPATAHIARVEIEDEHGDELQIYRRSVPYGRLAEHGLYFVAFSAERERFDRMLERMFGLADGQRDRLTDFSRPVAGAVYFAPPLTLLGLKEEPLHEREEVLRKIPLFAACSAHDLKSIASRAQTREFPAGATLCRQGTRGDGFFVIVDGSAEARRDGALLRTMGPGDFFGEIAVIDEGPRTATVTSTTALRCFTIGSHDFRDVLGQNANVAVRILDAVTRRLRAMLPPSVGNE